jgi:hypothetical protein
MIIISPPVKKDTVYRHNESDEEIADRIFWS